MRVTAYKRSFFLATFSIILFLCSCSTTQNSNNILNYNDVQKDTVYDTNAGIDIQDSVETFLSQNIVLINTPTPVPVISGNPVSNQDSSNTVPSDKTEEPSISPEVNATPSLTPIPTGVYEFNTTEYDIPLSDDMTAKAALLINISDQEAVYAYHVYEQIYPASITKLMTALLAFESGKLSEYVTISDTAANITYSGAKLCGFKSGDKILLEDLLTCMLVYSGNDTSVAVAEHIAGSEAAFVEQMNKRAVELGANSTTFCNSHGLPDDNHVTTAYDIYLIMNELFHYDKFLSIISKAVYTASYQTEKGTVTKTFHSTNGYYTDTYTIPEGITLLGGKTGTTGKAGYCISLLVRDQNDKLYIAEVFGATSMDYLYQEMNQMLRKIAVE